MGEPIAGCNHSVIARELDESIGEEPPRRHLELVSSEGAENDEYPKAGQNSCLGFVVSSTEGRALGIVEDVVVGSEGLLVALIVRGAEPSVTAIARDEIVHVGLEERRVVVERRPMSWPRRPWWLGRRRMRPSR